MKKEVSDALRAIRKRTDFVPKAALTLGSGLGNFADHIRTECEISYQDLPGFPVSTVPGHEGKFIFGYAGNVPIVCMKGRVHLYEGYSAGQVTEPVLVVRALGADILFLSNAAGGIRDSFHAGTLALITDQISCFVPNPLTGPDDEEEGPRFPDMSNVYDRELCALIREAAKENGIALDEGVYAQLTGPSYETPAEIRMLKILGADLVGMSTAVEAIAAVHAGMRVCGISLVTNMAAGLSKNPLSHEEVMAAGKAAEPDFCRLVLSAIQKMKDL